MYHMTPRCLSFIHVQQVARNFELAIADFELKYLEGRTQSHLLRKCRAVVMQPAQIQTTTTSS